MHYLVKLIVQADDEREALEKAHSDAEELVERGDFDWFDFHGRWGDSVAHDVKTEEGRNLIKDGMKANRQQFNEALVGIRYMLENYSDDEIYNEDFPRWQELEGKLPEGVYSLSRWHFTRAAGDSNAPCVYAVNGGIWGGRVDNDKALEDILRRYNKDANRLWVVPVDFHN